MRWWKWVGLAGVAGVAATGAVVARQQRQRAAVTPDEVRSRLHARLEPAGGVTPGPADTGTAPTA
jgi:hypothetical protein